MGGDEVVKVEPLGMGSVSLLPTRSQEAPALPACEDLAEGMEAL